MVDLNFRIDVGDIIEWNKNYFEIDSWNENQFFVGKDEHYRLDEQHTNEFGQSVSIVANTHLTRNTKLSITRQR